MKGQRRRGLTLIEVLIVVAIIAALAALLFPVFQSVRESAYITACRSNLKQLYHALQLYEEDYGELPYTPPGTHMYWKDREAFNRVGSAFYRAVYPYVKDRNVFFCPASPRPFPPLTTSYRYYYPFAKWRGYPITPNTVLLYCIAHADPLITQVGDVIYISFSPNLVCLMDGSIHLVHGLPRHRIEDVPFTYP